MTHSRLAPAFAAALVIAAFGCTSSEQRIANHLERARVYQESSQPDKALIELQAALKLDPQNAETNYQTGELLRTMERWDDSLFYFEEAHRLDPKRDDAELGIATLLRFNDTDRAEKLVEEVIARSPSNGKAHLLRSDLYLVRGDTNGALTSALTAQELDPKSARAALQVAMSRKAFIAKAEKAKETVAPNLYEETDAALSHAIELAKDDPDPVWLVRGVTERAELLSVWRGHGPEVVRLYQETYEQVKDYPVQARNLLKSASLNARRSKDREFLIWTLSRAVELDPSNGDAWVELANRTTQTGGDGLAVMERMVKERADDPRAHVTYAEYLSSNGKADDAIAYLQKVVPESKSQDSLLTALMTLQLLQRKSDDAGKTLATLREKFPDSVQTFFAEATFANYEGRTADAIAALERWTSREESPNGFAMLADARVRAGNPRDALDAIDRAIGASPRPRADYLRLRGRILVMLGDYEASIASFQKASRVGGNMPIDFLPDLARAFYLRGNPNAARQTLEKALAVDTPPPTALLLFGREEAQRDPVAARAALERGATLYPQQPVFVEMLVVNDLHAGHTDAALGRIRDAVERMPDSPRIQITLARVLVAAGRTDEAAKQAELVQQRWPGQPGVAELYLDVMTQSGHGDEAFQALAKERAAGTLLPSARVLLARLYVRRGEDGQALELLRSAVADQPDLPAAQNDLAYLLARRGEDLETSTELAQEARAARPDSSEIADTLGFVYLRRDLAEAALVQFDAALELAEAGSPGWATAQYHRGLALRQLGRTPDAVAALEQALASGAEFAEAKEAHQALADLGSSGAAAKQGS